MENLLDYLLYALFGRNVTSVKKSSNNLGVKYWIIGLEVQVYFSLDENDLAVIRALYKDRKERLDVEECARYMKIFETCV